jgi:ribonuclease HII
MRCSFRHERALRKSGVEPIAGIDEAGRGPLAGPVVAAAVILPEKFRQSLLSQALNDSKKLSAATRETLYGELTTLNGVYWAVSVVEAEEIDRINILRATHEGMRRAVASLPVAPRHVLIDGLAVKPFPIPQTAIVKGDAISFSIAAASILAKVTRDRLMREYDACYPEYGFSQHKGYGTEAHLDKLSAHGPCPIHRRSFLPVREAQLDLL